MSANFARGMKMGWQYVSGSVLIAIAVALAMLVMGLRAVYAVFV